MDARVSAPAGLLKEGPRDGGMTDRSWSLRKKVNTRVRVDVTIGIPRQTQGSRSRGRVLFSMPVDTY